MKANIIITPLLFTLGLQMTTCSGQTNNSKIVDSKDSVTQNKNIINMEKEQIIGKIGFVRENEDSIELGFITNARIFRASKTSEKFEAIKLFIKEASERDIPIELTVQNNSIMDAKIPKDK